MSANKFGITLLNVDAKGRISVPVATRELFDDNGGFLVWMDDRIALMLPKNWDRYYSSFQRDESVPPRQLELLAARAATCKIESQGDWFSASVSARHIAGNINGQVQMVPAMRNPRCCMRQRSGRANWRNWLPGLIALSELVIRTRCCEGV